MPSQAGVLVATLGSEPQVVTLTIDALLDQGEALCHVIILHTDTSQPVIGKAVSVLRSEFAAFPQYQGLHLTFEPLLINEQPVADIATPEAARTLLRVLYERVSALKESGERVHLCPAGGRKAMAMYAMLVAQLLFDEDDRLWMLVSSDTLRQERRLHAAPSESSLLRVPVLPWRLSLTEKQAFVERTLTPAEAKVLELAARYGLTDREIAERRVASTKTVSHQLSDIYDKLRVFLGYREDVRVDRHTLAAEFSAYFDVMEALGRQAAAPPADI